MDYGKLVRARKRIRAYMRDNGIPLDTVHKGWPKEMTKILSSILNETRNFGESHTEFQIRVAPKLRLNRRDLIAITPKWADHHQIKEKYQESKRITVETGIVHHVDHIVPIKGTKVCGLHTHENLRVIPASLNVSKSNKFV